jgi:hypothetical protein
VAILVNEDHPVQDIVILDRIGAQDPNSAGREKLLAGEDTQERRLACAIAAE